MCLKEEVTQILFLIPELFSDGALLQVEGQLLHMYFDGSFLHQLFILNIKYIFRMNGFFYLIAYISMCWQFTFHCVCFSKDGLFTSENTITAHNPAIRAPSSDGGGPRTYFSRRFKGKRRCD